MLYLTRTDFLLARDTETEARVQRDVGHIGDWLKKDSKNYPLFIIGTHGDLADPDLTELPPDKIGDYEDELRHMPIFKELAHLGSDDSNPPTFIFGSLKSKKTTEKLVSRIINQLTLSR